MKSSHDTQADIEVSKYLARKLGLTIEWFDKPLDLLFGATPKEVIMAGEGEHVIAWLESRLGISTIDEPVKLSNGK